MKIHDIKFSDQDGEEFNSFFTKSRIEKRIWPQFHKAIAVEWLYQKHNQKKTGMQPFISDIVDRQIINDRKIRQLERDLRHIEGLLKDAKGEDFLGMDFRACMQRARMIKMRQIEKIKGSNDIY